MDEQEQTAKNQKRIERKESLSEYNKSYYQKTIEKRKTANKNYWEKTKEKREEYRKNYYKTNKEKVKAKNKELYISRDLKIKREYRKKYKEENLDLLKQKEKEYYDSNLESIKKKNLSKRRDVKGKLIRVHQEQCARSKKRGHSKPSYSKEQFVSRFSKDEIYLELHSNWVKHAFIKKLAPSFNRLNNLKGYSFDNIECITWQEHMKKAPGPRKVKMNKDDEVEATNQKRLDKKDKKSKSHSGPGMSHQYKRIEINDFYSGEKKKKK